MVAFVSMWMKFYLVILSFGVLGSVLIGGVGVCEGIVRIIVDIIYNSG